MRNFSEGALRPFPAYTAVPPLEQALTESGLSILKITQLDTWIELSWKWVLETNMISKLLLAIKSLNSEARRLNPLKFHMSTERKFKFLEVGNLPNWGGGGGKSNYGQFKKNEKLI